MVTVGQQGGRSQRTQRRHVEPVVPDILLGNPGVMPGVLIGPPNVVGFPEPASSISTSSTLDAL
jgi:hypothetical protein